MRQAGAGLVLFAAVYLLDRRRTRRKQARYDAVDAERAAKQKLPAAETAASKRRGGGDGDDGGDDNDQTHHAGPDTEAGGVNGDASTGNGDGGGMAAQAPGWSRQRRSDVRRVVPVVAAGTDDKAQATVTAAEPAISHEVARSSAAVLMDTMRCDPGAAQWLSTLLGGSQVLSALTAQAEQLLAAAAPPPGLEREPTE